MDPIITINGVSVDLDKVIAVGLAYYVDFISETACTGFDITFQGQTSVRIDFALRIQSPPITFEQRDTVIKEVVEGTQLRRNEFVKDWIRYKRFKLENNNLEK